MRKLICKYCQEEFFVSEVELRNGNHKGIYCSRKCFLLDVKLNGISQKGVNHPNWKGGKVENDCLYCHKSFQSPPCYHQKYCSRKCARLAKVTSISIICLNCGKEFLAEPSQVKKNRSYCSQKCLSEHRKGKNHHQYTKISTHCEGCGKPLKVNPYRIEHNKNGTYCSRECFHKAISKKILKICIYCQKEFLISKSKNSKYCNDDCYNACRGRKPKQCPVCKKMFINRHIASNKYCSVECTGISQRRRVKKNCLLCGKEYWVKKSQEKTSKFCCKSHHSIYSLLNMPVKNTIPEKIIEAELIKLKISFNSQYVIFNRYIVDFYLPKNKIVIEADGDYFHNLPKVIAKDRRENEDLIKAGYIVIRLKEKDLKQHPNHPLAFCQQYCLNRITALLWTPK